MLEMSDNSDSYHCQRKGNCTGHELGLEQSLGPPCSRLAPFSTRFPPSSQLVAEAPSIVSLHITTVEARVLSSSLTPNT